jgi:hypothetical protein
MRSGVAMVVLQRITVTWWKSARGAPAATLRNALPKALPLIPAKAAYVFQGHAFHEKGDGYAHRLVEETTSDEVPRQTGCIVHVVEQAGLSVGVFWGPYGGNPHRKSRPRAMLLAPGTIGRALVNARHTGSDGHWYYTRDIYNLALVERADEDLFTSAERIEVCDLEADLF